MVIIYWFFLIVMLVGIVGFIILGLFGFSLILVVILVWGFVYGFSGIGWILGIVIFVLVLSILIDFLVIYWGVK